MGIIKVFREMRAQIATTRPQLEQHLKSRGLMNRFLGKLTKSVTKPRQMYPIGVLFGLGFDTATRGRAARARRWRSRRRAAVVRDPLPSDPVRRRMSLMDSIDGSFMNFAYGWAFSQPVRKVFYNLTITGLSVAIALVIGTIELGGLTASQLNLSGPFWNWFESIDINLLGFVIVGLFLVTWVIALAFGTSARRGAVDERQPGDAPREPLSSELTWSRPRSPPGRRRSLRRWAGGIQG